MISGRDELPKFDSLRADCVQEECRLEARGNGRKSHHEEDYVLATQTSKRKGRKGNFKRNRGRNSVSAPQPKKKDDLSRIQCFKCNKYGHFAKDYLTKAKHHAAATNVDDA